MIETSRQLKDLIRNLAKEKQADAQILLRNYMMERFLERVSLSAYQDKFILKGGMLVAAMVGIDARSTMDMDATIKATTLGIDQAKHIIDEILSVPLEDGVTFTINKVSEIMEEAEYPAIRIGMEARFDGMRTPIKIDISTGDMITPREITYSFRLMLQNRSIDVLAYNLETVLAEKLETVISRAYTNTRMRDFYDIHILQTIYGDSLQIEHLRNALMATAKKRETLRYIRDGKTVVEGVATNQAMEKLWGNYCKMFPYAKGLSWQEVTASLKSLYDMTWQF